MILLITVAGKLLVQQSAALDDGFTVETKSSDALSVSPIISKVGRIGLPFSLHFVSFSPSFPLF